MQKMKVFAKISCYFERSVVTLKLCKEYLNTVTYNSHTPDTILNSLLYTLCFKKRHPFYFYDNFVRCRSI